LKAKAYSARTCPKGPLKRLDNLKPSPHLREKGKSDEQVKLTTTPTPCLPSAKGRPMLTDDEIRAMLAGCEGVTPGKWIGSPVISSMAGLPVVASSGRLICDMNHVRHSKIDQFVEGDKAFNSESIRNAAHIARCDPTTIAELCTRLLSAEAKVTVLEEALRPFSEAFWLKDGRTHYTSSGVDQKDIDHARDVMRGWETLLEPTND
jgi:hypothetical protein